MASGSYLSSQVPRQANLRKHPLRTLRPKSVSKREPCRRLRDPQPSGNKRQELGSLFPNGHLRPLPSVWLRLSQRKHGALQSVRAASIRSQLDSNPCCALFGYQWLARRSGWCRLVATGFTQCCRLLEHGWLESSRFYLGD